MNYAKALFVGAGLLVAAASWAGDARSIERGRYLVRTAGCNDCHTSGYISNAGKIAEKEWLKGDAVGFRGPWGTTYPSNLRRYFAALSENAFIADVRSGRMRPPMPWFNLSAMTDADLRAIRRYVRSLGEPGAPAPAYVPPDAEPNTPYIVFVPQAPRIKQAREN
jgi:mono/diheme cytochrome c family protein